MSSGEARTPAPGPFELLEKRPGRPVTTKQTVSSILLRPNGTVVLGNTDGQVVFLQSPDKREESLVILLRAKRPVTKLERMGRNDVLAVCGNELFHFEGRELSRKQPFSQMKNVADISVLDRGGGNYTICVATSVSTPIASSVIGETLDDCTLHYFFSTSSGQFAKQREVAIRDAVGLPTQLIWCSPSVVCVGGTKSAVMVDGRGALKRVPIMVDPKKGPLLLTLKYDRVLLSSAGGIGVVVDLNALPSPNQGTIIFSSPPVALCCSGPYIIALSSEETVEISLLDSPGDALQTFLIPNASHALASDHGMNDILGTASSDMFGFVVGLTNQYSDEAYRQARSLSLHDRLKGVLIVDEGDCSRALSLVRDSVNSPEKRHDMERYMYLQAAAVILAKQLDFNTAFALLSAGGVDCVGLLALCGLVVGEEAFDGIDERGLEAVRSAIHESRLFDNILFRTQIQEHILEMRESSGASTRLDTAIVLLLADIGTTQALEKFCKDKSNRCDLELCTQRLDALGLVLPSTLLRLARGGQITVEMVQHLRQMERKDVLVDLLTQEGMFNSVKEEQAQSVVQESLSWLLPRLNFEEALSLIKKVSAQLGDDLSWIDHLQNLHHRDAIMSAILLAKRDYGEVVDDIMLARYLARAIESLKMDGERKKADPLIEALGALVRSNHRAAEAALTVLQQSKMKLKLGAERAWCLGALGRHREALNIYITELNDYEGAERYCEMNQNLSRRRDSHIASEADVGGSGVDPFTALLSIHLERFSASSEGSGTRAEAALSFLSRHAARVDPLEAVQVLPESLSVLPALAFLEKAVLRVSHDRRSSRVEKGLARAENLKVKLDLVKAQRQHVVVSHDTRCTVCGDFLAVNEVVPVVRDPISASLSHLSCKREGQAREQSFA